MAAIGGLTLLFACVPSAGMNGTASPVATSTLVTGLEVPWALDFLPDGSIIFTERPGRVRMVEEGGRLVNEPLLVLDDVAAQGEGGLLGIAVHPDFSRTGLVYLYYTYENGGSLANRVVRYRLDGRQLTSPEVVIKNIPGASIHDGGRIKFGPDGLLYITTGDASVADRAQDRNSLSGKILRLRDDGSIPAENPFAGSPVYSLGHRNPEGIAWDDKGRLWETEHGSSATDEVNIIQAGQNYGWPLIRGDEESPGMQRPVLQSGSVTWAPAGLAFAHGSLFFAGLRGQSLFEIVSPDGSEPLLRYFEGAFGRLREVVTGPDGRLYITTSNRDGRGSPNQDDDRIIIIDTD